MSIAVGWGIGWWLDKTFDTRPYLTLIMLLFGIVAGFRALYRAAREYQRQEKNEDDGNRE